MTFEVAHTVTEHEKAQLAAELAKKEFMRTIPAGSRMRVSREEKQIKKREYNKKPEVKERRRIYDQRPHVKLKRWVKNHTPIVVGKRKAYSSRDDVKVRRYIMTQRRRQLSNDCVRLLTDGVLYNADGTHTYTIENRRLVGSAPDGRHVMHRLKGSHVGWLNIPVLPGTTLDQEMYDGNLHAKETSEVLQLIKDYYERAHNTTLSPGEKTSGGGDTGDTGDTGDSSDSEHEDGEIDH